MVEQHDHDAAVKKPEDDLPEAPVKVVTDAPSAPPAEDVTIVTTTKDEPVNQAEAGEVAPVRYPWWRAGDGESFATVVSDNLATIVVLIGVLLSKGFAGVTVFAKILPGMGLSILVGNIYYAWQATRLAKKEGRVNITAQPYGINTPGAFVFLYSILIDIYFKEVGKGASPKDAGESAYRAAVLANLISGFMEVLGAVLGPWMLRNIPFPALTTPLAGIGLAYLALNHLLEVFRHGLVGLLPLFIMITSYFGNMRFKYFPAVWVAVLLSTAVAWAGKYKHQSEVEDAWNLMKNDRWEQFWDFPLAHMSAKEAEYATDYMSLIIPVSITNFMSTMEVVSSAHLAGDRFDVAETMAIDGIGTMIGALFGSPFGTTVYIGHPAYKQMGGSRGYSLLNGVVLFILCFTGLAGLVMSCLSREGLVVVIVFVGLALAQQTVEHTPIRQYPTLFLGFMPIFAEWAAQKKFLSRASAEAEGLLGWWYLSQGAMLVSLGLTVTLYFAINRTFIKAAITAAITSIAALIGLIHDDKIYGPSDDITSPKYEWFFAWLMVSGYCLLMWVAQTRFGWIEPPIDEACFHVQPYTDDERESRAAAQADYENEPAHHA
eukprot:TRINITY_DN27959_c0_g2_i1.p2 TRINITY_DN27959_c0_g2~~TRINITY_DN27959_c0_g2_i1.p2  ORF type:complete len:611 (+),score=246.54 TRINITY_DN27959_c0_g2_i1:30-1835(+)